MSDLLSAWAVDRDSPLRPDVVALLEQHLQDMRVESPPESVHALDPAALDVPGTAFWTARTGDGTLLGCAALKGLSPGHAELKSMRTAAAARGRGVGSGLLDHVLAHAAASGHRRVSLETGTQPFFLPARSLYLSRGFVDCGPFDDYVLDPWSVFMTRAVDDG